MEICKQQSEIVIRYLPTILICGYVGGRFKRYGSIDRY